MDTLSTNSLIIVLVTMLLSAFFSGTELAFVSANKVRLEIDTQKGGLVNRIINMFYNNSEVFISTMLVGNNVVNVVYSMAMASLIGAPIYEMLGENEFLQLLVLTIISTVIILITGEFLPKTLFRINPNASLRMVSLPLFLFYCILYPLSRFTEMLSQLLMRMFGVKIDKEKMDRLTVEELDAYLQETIDKREDENEEVEREVKIFENALDFSDTHLGVSRRHRQCARLHFGERTFRDRCELEGADEAGAVRPRNHACEEYDAESAQRASLDGDCGR